MTGTSVEVPPPTAVVRGESSFSDNQSELMQAEDGTHNVQTLDIANAKRISERQRFIMMTVAVFASLCGSTSYAFNLFSGDLQRMYDLDSRQMSNISTVGMVFCYFLLPYGAIFDYFGPRPIYTLGCILFPLGALLMGLTFQGVIEGSVVRFCVYNALLSLGSQLFDLATVIAMLSVFPIHKSWVVALLKTMMGLGSAIIASIRIGFFTTHPSNYFYFLIGLVVVVGVGVQLVVKLPPYHLTGWDQKRLSPEKKAKRMATRVAYLTQEPPMWRFYLGVGIIIVLSVYLPLTSALTAFLHWGDGARVTIAIIAIVLTCSILLMAVPCGLLDRLTTKRNHSEEEEASLTEEREDAEGNAAEPIHLEVITSPNNNDSNNNNNNKAVSKVVETDIDYIAPQYQTTFLQSCCTLRLWCIFWTMFCGVGTEFVIIFNARFIYTALDTTPDETVATLLTVLNGAGSALGRLAMCVFEEWTQKRPAEKRIPITMSFFVPTMCIMVSIPLFLVLPGRSILLAYALAALGNGFCASVTILVLRTIYAKDPAKHYNFGYNALWTAAIVLNRFLYGEWIAVQAEKQNSKICHGKVCVLMPMLVMLGLNVSAFVSNIYLHISYSRFSRKVLDERRRLKEDAARQEDDEVDADAFPVKDHSVLADLHVSTDSLRDDVALTELSESKK